MASKKAHKTLAKGDYVRINKSTIGVVTKVSRYDDLGDESDVTGYWVEHLDTDGVSRKDWYGAKRVTKIAAPQYVVVWTDEYSDPFCQFETRADADKFAARKRKDSSVVEVRLYKLTK